MYSVVLMAVLTAGGDAPGWHHKHGCNGGCHGGYATAGCYGCYGGCSGCWGSCSGGGCWGSCSGGGCYGCYGGSCYGSTAAWGGGWGGSGSCYGGCWGGCYGCHGCYGCYGCYGCNGYSGTVGPVQVTPYAAPVMPGAPVAPAQPTTPETAPAPKPSGTGTSALTPNQARVIVEVPADAKLYIDDQLTKTGSTRRVFRTPELEKGKVYYYIARVEVQRDGQTYTDTKRILVRTGQEIVQSFNDLGGPASTGTATADARSER